jgi:hypothetical protein
VRNSSELQKPAIIKLIGGFLLRVEFLTEFARRLSLNFHAVIPLLWRLVKPSLDFANNRVTVLNEFAISRKGTTDRSRSNNTVIIELHNAK